MTVFNANCLDGMRWFPDNTFDSIVTDPPYELGFMGKKWDSSGIANDVEMWREALRVLKPGGHLLAFSGSRTYHRMVCAIEDAGFEIRDQIMWIYGAGFPKSHNVSVSIDKLAGVMPEKIARVRPDGRSTGHAGATFNASDVSMAFGDPVSPEAQEWKGWGTALKPAHEPLCVARKPLVGTVAANVLQFGTGAINIDACRVGDDVTGRWPANLIHDGSDEVLAAFPAAPGQLARALVDVDQRKTQNMYGNMARGSNGSEPRADTGSAARFFYCAKASKADRDEGLATFAKSQRSDPGALRDGTRETEPRANTHPTVKPTALMRYLCRLVTPPGGSILDPFAGSGSTGKAATLEGFSFIGFELDEHYAAIANARLKAVA